jgi:hypothetical protein
MTREFARSAGHGSPARKQFFLTLENELCHLFDATLLTSRSDLCEITATRRVPNAHFVPAKFETPSESSTDLEQACEYDLLFVGEDNPANREGVHWFYHHVYQMFLRHHGMRWAIAGAVADVVHFEGRKIFRLPLADGDDFVNLSKASQLAIVPIFDDEGNAFQVLEALARGCAVITTPAAIRGLPGLAESAVVLDMKADPHAAAMTILELCASPTKRLLLQRKASAYISQNYGSDAFFAAMDGVMKSLESSR